MLIIYNQGSLFECVGQHVMNYLKVRTSVGLPTQPQIILQWAVSSKRRNLTSLARRRLTALCSVLTYVQRAAQNVLSEKDSPVFKHILYTLPFTTRPFNSISSSSISFPSIVKQAALHLHNEGFPLLFVGETIQMNAIPILLKLIKPPANQWNELNTSSFHHMLVLFIWLWHICLLPLRLSLQNTVWLPKWRRKSLFRDSQT